MLFDDIRRFHGSKGFDFEGVDDGQIKSKVVSFTKLSVDGGNRLVNGMASTTSVDMDGMVVLSTALDQSYFPRRHKAVYLNHNYFDLPVGTCRSLTPKGDGLEAVTFVTRRAIGDELLTCMEEGALNGLSIAFRTSNVSEPTIEEAAKYPGARSVARSGILIEYSLTPMPVNQDALISLVSRSMIRRASAVVFGLKDTPRRVLHAVAPTAATKARLALVLSGGYCVTLK